MDQSKQTRRSFLQNLVSLCALGCSTILHAPAALAGAAASALARIKGRIINKDDRNYPLWWASMTWYIFKPKRYPDSIIRATSEQDVVAAINYAREKGEKIVVRSTGHNPARAVLREGGVLLDLSQLREVEIDAENKTAWIQPGIRAEELLNITTRHGLVFPAAHTGIVGLGGYLLGGGVGWNAREYGIACRSVLAADIITADGNRFRVSEENKPDLHWAVRGVGPGFFAAAVRYKLQLFPLHRALILNKYIIPVKKINAAVQAFREIGNAGDRRLEILIKIGRFHPPGKPYANRDLVCTVGFFAFADSPEDARALMLPVTQSRIADLSIIKKEHIPLRYAQLYNPPATDYSSPNRTAVGNIWTDELAQSLPLLTEKIIAEPPVSPRSFILAAWSINSTFNDPGSCIRTDARHYMSWYLIAEKAEDITPNCKWMDESVALLRPLAKGHYINEIDPVRYPHHVEECFSTENWNKLGMLRKKYDPAGVFHTYLGHT